MDPSAFDALVKASAPAQTRRWLLALLAALPLGGVLARFSAAEAPAERPHERLGRRTEQRNERRSNTTNHHPTAGGNPTAGDDLPDVGRVTCWFTCTVRINDCTWICADRSVSLHQSCLMQCNQTADPVSDCNEMGDQRLAAFRLECFPQCDQIRDHCVKTCGPFPIPPSGS